MGTWSKCIESFHLTVENVSRQFRKIPSNTSEVLYHYTTHSGLEGILRSGGLRATYRMKMNDTGEFDYAKNVIFKALDEIGKCHNLPPVAQNIATYTRTNLDRYLVNTVEMSRAYCACLTVSSDHPKQWETYAELGKGFAIGINILEFLKNQRPNAEKGNSFIFCNPVIYNKTDQRDLICRLVKAGIHDLQTFSNNCSKRAEDLTAFRNRITKEIVVQLFILIDFIKAPSYSSELEFRLISDSNDTTLMASHIQYYKGDSKAIPFIFMDLRDPKTGRLPLAEIKVGPMTSFPEEKTFLEGLLNELGYGSNYEDRPRIIQSTQGGHETHAQHGA